MALTIDLDAFTIRHLAAYVAEAVHENDRDAFSAWALETLNDDPTLADLGWPSLYRTWQGIVSH